jgi:hypothetical protein
MKKTKTRIESADKDDDDEIIRRKIFRHHESKTLIERLVELTRCGNVVMFARRWKSAMDSSHRREQTEKEINYKRPQEHISS